MNEACDAGITVGANSLHSTVADDDQQLVESVIDEALTISAQMLEATLRLNERLTELKAAIGG